MDHSKAIALLQEWANTTDPEEIARQKEAWAALESVLERPRSTNDRSAMNTTELVTKLLAQGGKEFPHQWAQNESSEVGCVICGQELHGNNEKCDCPELLYLALDLTRQQLADALDTRL